MESNKCKWAQNKNQRDACDTKCRKHAPVIVPDTERLRGEDHQTVYPDALCPCGDYEEKKNEENF